MAPSSSRSALLFALIITCSSVGFQHAFAAATVATAVSTSDDQDRTTQQQQQQQRDLVAGCTMKTKMRRTVLMSTNDILDSGKRITHASAGLHFDLNDDGTMSLWKDIHNASTAFQTTSVKLWDNIDSIEQSVWFPTNHTYRTVMQNNGNLVTFGISRATNERVVGANIFMSLPGGSTVGSPYSLVVEEEWDNVVASPQLPYCSDDGDEQIDDSSVDTSPRLSIIRGPPQQRDPDRIWSVPIADVESAAGTSRPDETPLLDEGIACGTTGQRPTVLMKSGDFLYPGKRIIDYDRGVFLYQTMIGTVQIKAGTPERPGDLLWQSDYAGLGENSGTGTSGGPSYYTKFEATSNLVTWKTDDSQNYELVWESGTYRQALEPYYLVVDCYEFKNRVAIYQGDPTNSYSDSNNAAVVWMADSFLGENTNIQPVPRPTAPPTDAPTDQPTTAPVVLDKEDDDDDDDSILEIPSASPSGTIRALFFSLSATTALAALMFLS